MINASDSITPSEYGMARQALNDVENPPPMHVHVIPGAAEPASGRGQRLIPEYAPGVTIPCALVDDQHLAVGLFG